ncbi:hypothetical protein BX600DRAFT_54663 [Xylariales sp. PMI_506]|nr:hypothetical protein BX600DRAFT_54663 [Xylariales sp. PMI_506]
MIQRVSFLVSVALLATALEGRPNHRAPAHYPRAAASSDVALSMTGCRHQTPVYSVNSVDFISDITFPAGGFDGLPNEQQLAFGVVNSANQVSTQCFLSNYMTNGQTWDDQGTRWYPCLDQTVVDSQNQTYTVKTSTQFNWNLFNVTVNQTWACEDFKTSESYTVYGNFSAQLAPSCQGYETTFVNITECTAPDLNCNGTARFGGQVISL